jgi:hypothetical protein
LGLPLPLSFVGLRQVIWCDNFTHPPRNARAATVRRGGKKERQKNNEVIVTK